MQQIIAQYATTNNDNDTIFFFSNLNRKQEDEQNGQFFNIPLGLQSPIASDQLALKRKPKMSFFVSAPFEGQAVILNDSYVVQDTIIMRIDCDVTKTEYIGYGSDPSDSLNTGEEGSSDFQDLGNGTFGFEYDILVSIWVSIVGVE